MRLEHIYAEETTSTLDMARKNKELDPNVLCVYTTGKQTQARGSHSRAWQSPLGVNIFPTYSFLLEKTAASHPLVYFPLISGYSVVSMLKTYGLNATLKWPNDVLLSQKKMTGILCESGDYESKGKKYIAVNMGVGVNVNMDAESCGTINQPATSMLLEAGREFKLAEVQTKLNEAFMENIPLLIDKGFSYFHEKISGIMEKYDDHPIIFDPLDNGSYQGLIQGVITGISSTGLLKIKAEEKEMQFLNGRILKGNDVKNAFVSNPNIMWIKQALEITMK